MRQRRVAGAHEAAIAGHTPVAAGCECAPVTATPTRHLGVEVGTWQRAIALIAILSVTAARSGTAISPGTSNVPAPPTLPTASSGAPTLALIQTALAQPSVVAAQTTAGSSPAAPPGGGGGTVADACSFLTDADIKATTGYAVVTKKSGPQMGIYSNGCDGTLDSGGVVAAEIVLGAMSPGGRSYFTTYLEPYQGEYVPNVGDAAVRDEAGSISAIKNDTFLDIQYVEFPDPKQDVVTELMKRALAHA